MLSSPAPVEPPARAAAAARPREGALHDSLFALRARWWLPLVAAAASMLAAWAATSRQTPLYRATASLVVTPTSAINEPSDIVRSLETLDRRSVIATFARIPGSASARAAVAAKLGLQPALPGWRVEGSVLPNTNIIRIDAEGPEPARAAEVANASAEVTANEARSLYRIFTMRWLSTASVPSRPAEPDLRRNLLVAAAVGLLLGVLGAMGLQRLRAHPSRA